MKAGLIRAANGLLRRALLAADCGAAFVIPRLVLQRLRETGKKTRVALPRKKDIFIQFKALTLLK